MSRSWTVVVVDDTEPIRRLVRMYVEDAGAFTVVGEAGDGKEAVEVIGELRPDVIVLDLAMPVMDGLEALPLIRQVVPDAKVIVLTGFGTDAVVKAAMDAGASCFVDKGADMASLLAAALKQVTAGGQPDDRNS